MAFQLPAQPWQSTTDRATTQSTPLIDMQISRTCTGAFGANCIAMDSSGHGRVIDSRKTRSSSAPKPRKPAVSAPGRFNQCRWVGVASGSMCVRQRAEIIAALGMSVVQLRVIIASSMEKVRISKLMAQQGLCSRREADAFLAAGLVTVDGQRVGVGDKALPTQRIVLDQQGHAQQRATVTILINKPIGLVSGQAEEGYKPAVTLVLPANRFDQDRSGIPFKREHLRGLAVAGRLDIDSTGLLVLTQDGRVARQLIGQDSEIEKEYLVRVKGKLSAQGLARLRHGLSLDGRALKPAQVSWQNEDQLKFVLKEGRKRQIRRMCELVGLTVLGLKRVRIGQIKLGHMPLGQWRYLAPNETI